MPDDFNLATLVEDVNTWVRLHQGNEAVGPLITDPFDDAVLLPALFAHVDRCLDSDDVDEASKGKILQLDLTFLVKYLQADQARIKKLFMHCSGDEISMFIDDVIASMQDADPEHIFQSISLVNSIFSSHLIFTDHLRACSRKWVFALLNIAKSFEHNQQDENIMAGLTLLFTALVPGLGARMQTQKAQMQRDINEYVNNKHQMTLHAIRTIKLFLSTLIGIDFRDADGKTIMHHLAALKFKHSDVRELVEYLFELGLDPNAANAEGKTALQIALENKVQTDFLDAVFVESRISIAEQESLLYKEAEKPVKNVRNILFIFEKLLARSDWSNFALRIQGRSLWSAPFLVDQQLISGLARVLYGATTRIETTLERMLDAIKTANGDATYVIAVCIYGYDNSKPDNGNIMLYLADRPDLCRQLLSVPHTKLLERVFRNSWYNVANNIKHLCFNCPVNPMQIAITQGNLPMLMLVLRYTYPELNHTQADRLRSAIIEVIKANPSRQEVPALQEYLISKTDCLPGYHRSLLRSVRTEVSRARVAPRMVAG